MRRSFRMMAVAVAVLAVAGLASAQTVTWNIDTAHSSVGFGVRHMMVSTVRGSFAKFTGAIQVKGSDPTTASFDVTIDVASVDTREPKRDEHLKSPDFFDAAKFPTITFKSKRVDKGGAGTLKVTGDLTIKGVTREVVLDVDGPTPESKDPWGNTRVGAQATAKINRKDFGLGWNKALETGGVLVGEDVTITLDVELVKKV